jgi:superoxide dismutase, Cu-Zn family
MKSVWGLVAWGVVVVGCSSTPRTADGAGAVASASLEAKSGSSVSGAATFTSTSGGKVTAKVSVAHAPPGKHAVHLHVNGDCSAPDAQSAGAHWNPTIEAHGKWGEPPHHLGDIGNLEVDGEGKGELSLTTDRWVVDGTPGPDGQPKLNDVVGRAVVVHAAVDDFTTQPTGNAGGRMACGVIRRN